MLVSAQMTAHLVPSVKLVLFIAENSSEFINFLKAFKTLFIMIEVKIMPCYDQLNTKTLFFDYFTNILWPI